MRFSVSAKRLVATCLLLSMVVFFQSASIAAPPDEEGLKKKPVVEKPVAEKPVVEKAEPAEKEQSQLPWLASLAEGQRKALAGQSPILVRVGDEFCPWCRKLEEEIAKPDVQAELKRWTLVELNSRKSSADALRLGVNGIPALRILTPRGRIVQSQNGYLDDEELLAWLQEHFESAAAETDDVLLSSEEPSLLEVIRLVGSFEQRDATIREAAVRRLAIYPTIARESVVDAFLKGNLSSRLTALELLRRWDAPVEEFDPWRPETFNKQRVAALKKWPGPDEKAHDGKRPATLTEAELETAQHQIDRMLKVSSTEAAAIRERLSRWGEALLPEVYERLKESDSDANRARLAALRYRLVADDALELRWPGGIARLASADAQTRHQAVDELAKTANRDQQRLLLELFSDADPLVREISLRGLRNIGGKKATEALVKLLDDPEPNVRAAVLKQLTEDASAKLLPHISKYMAREKDPDLLVHAIRYLKALKDKSSQDSLLPLLKHESWQVRAEAAEALGKLVDNNSHYYGGDVIPEKSLSKIQKALLALLADSDAFVVSRALTGLQGIDSKEAVEPLVKTAELHPTLAPEVVEILASSLSMREKAIPRLREFCQHQQPAVRAAAISGLGSIATDGIDNDLRRAMADESSLVRISAANALLRILERGRPSNSNSPYEVDDLNIHMHDSYIEIEPPKSITQSLFEKIFGALKSEADKNKPATPEAKEIEAKETDDKEASDKGTEAKEPEIENIDLGNIKITRIEDPDSATEPTPKPLTQKPSTPKTSTLKPSTQKPSTPNEESNKSDPVLPSVDLAETENPPAIASPAIQAELVLPPGFAPPHVVGLLGPPTSFPSTVPSGRLAGKMKYGEGWDRWLKELHAGKHRPKWTATLVKPLEKMLESEELDERLAAALALVPLGNAAVATPVLLEAARSKSESFKQALAALRWLDWDRRIKMFEHFDKAARNSEERGYLVYSMGRVADHRAAGLFWDMLQRDEISEYMVNSLLDGLRKSYFGERHYDISSLSVRKRNQTAKALEPRLESGTPIARLAALNLLLSVLPDKALVAANKLANSDALDASLQNDAFQIALIAQTPSRRTKAAIEILSGENKIRRHIALGFLVFGTEALTSLPGSKMSLSVGYDMLASRSRTSGELIVPTPPRRLKAEHVREFIEDSDSQVAAHAGYLLCLLGEPQGLPPLLRHWRSMKDKSRDWDRLVYRAVAALDAPGHLPVLREIYSRLSSYRRGEFYWTIRIMTGDEILKFRKEIRKEVGMSNLR